MAFDNVARGKGAVVRGEMRHASGLGVLEASPDFRTEAAGIH